MALQAAYARLLATHGPLIAKAYQRVIAVAKKNIDEKELIAAIDSRNILAIQNAVGITQAEVFPLTEAVRAAYIGGGLAVGEVVGGSFGFNALQPSAARWVEQNTARLVQGIQDQSREMVQDVVRRGVIEGRSTAAMARDIIGQGKERSGSRVGLTVQQSTYVDNARIDLQDLSERYFTRAQRDRRFDAQVRAAIDEGKPLSDAQIAQITGRYAEKLEKYRATDIARQETRSATAAGQFEGYAQVAADPDVEVVTVRWQYNNGDQKDPREDHVRMDGEVRTLGDAFVMDDGTQMLYPHDPNGGPAQNAHCHCSPFFRTVFKAE